MAYQAWFDAQENRVLLAICARRLIRKIGIGGIVWGSINTVFGLYSLWGSPLNLIGVGLALLMLYLGVEALLLPSLKALLGEAAISVLLLLWHALLLVLTRRGPAGVPISELVFPLIAAGVFTHYYLKLRPVRDLITTVSAAEVRNMTSMCKALARQPLKGNPRLAETSDRKCRVQLFADKAFFVQRDLRVAFVAPRAELRRVVAKFDRKSLRFRIAHPLQTLRYSFARESARRIGSWLATATPPAAPKENLDIS